ncbi:MAG: hypothetical protein ACYCSG_02265, partial [Thermoplasmataceae archaeon]
LSNGNETVLKSEISIIPLLNSGRIRDACEIARKRLLSSGLVPISSKFPDTYGGERISAALIFPVRNERSLFRMVLYVKEQVI